MMVHAARVNVEEHATKVLSELRMMRQHHDHCDFVIKVENDEYHTHKNVMAAGSEYFRAMLAHDTKESRDGQITFEDVDSDCVKNCINFIYSGEFEIPEGKIKDLLHIGIMLRLEGVKQIISEILAESINAENYHSTTNIADMYELHDVSSKCQRFFIENLMEIANQPEFENMGISELVDILKAEDLKYSEEEKLTILLKWAENNPKENNALLNAIKRFKLEKMASPFLRNLLKTHPVISNDFMIYKLISDHLLEEKAVQVAPIQNKQNMASKSEVEEKSLDANTTLSRAKVKHEQQAIATGFAPNQGQSTSSQSYERPQDLDCRDSGSNIALSKAPLTLLRHKEWRNIPVDAAGYTFVEQSLRSPQFRKFNSTEQGLGSLAEKMKKDATIDTGEYQGHTNQTQPQRRAKIGKKMQKWEAMDLSSVPGPPVQQSTTSQRSTNQWQSDRRDEAPRSTPNSGYYLGQSSSNQRYERSHDQGYRDRGSNIALTKALGTLLRHRKPHNIPIDEAGYAFVEQLLRHRQFQQFHASEKAVNDIVKSDTQGRFETKGVIGDNFQIRATRGYSFKLKAEASGLRLIEDPHKFPMVVHGTYQQNWRAIKREGLKSMTRSYVHFAIGFIGEAHVTSGMSNTCDLCIILDMPKAMKDGLKFYVSSNKVIFCRGVDGAVSPKYFKAIKKWDYNYNQWDYNQFVFEE